jgi:hypothetical protein
VHGVTIWSADRLGVPSGFRHREPVLQQRLAALDREIEKHFYTAADLMLARIPDSQGLGGRSGERR